LILLLTASFRCWKGQWIIVVEILIIIHAYTDKAKYYYTKIYNFRTLLQGLAILGTEKVLAKYQLRLTS